MCVCVCVCVLYTYISDHDGRTCREAQAVKPVKQVEKDAIAHVNSINSNTIHTQTHLHKRTHRHTYTSHLHKRWSKWRRTQSLTLRELKNTALRPSSAVCGRNSANSVPQYIYDIR